MYIYTYREREREREREFWGLGRFESTGLVFLGLGYKVYGIGLLILMPKVRCTVQVCDMSSGQYFSDNYWTLVPSVRDCAKLTEGPLCPPLP